MREISIIIFIILIYRKLGSVGPAQQKIKLPSPYWKRILIDGISFMAFSVNYFYKKASS